MKSKKHIPVNDEPVIKLSARTPGKINAHSISCEFDPFVSSSYSSGFKGSSVIRKNSTQLDDSDLALNYMPPPINQETANNFYEQNPFHFRCINLKALAVAGVGHDIIPVDKSVKEYTNHPQYKLAQSFIDAPNTEGDFFEDIITNWLIDKGLYGYAFLEVAGIGNKLKNIYNLRAWNVYARKYYKNLYYIQRNLTKEVWFRPLNTEYGKAFGEVIVLKNYSPKSKYYGLPDWYSAVGDLLSDRAIIEHRLNKFENSLMMQFMIIVEGGEISSDALAEIKTFLKTNYKGVSNSGKVLYLNSDNPDVKIKIEKIEVDIPEVGFIKSREQHRDFTLAAHGVAAILLGVKTSGQLGGTTEIKDQFKVFNETMVKPEKKRIQKIINNLFKSRLGITDFEIEFRELNIDTLKDLTDFVSRMKPAGVIDENESRACFDYKPRDGEAAVPDVSSGNVEPVLKKLRGMNKEIIELRKSLIK